MSCAATGIEGRSKSLAARRDQGPLLSKHLLVPSLPVCTPWNLVRVYHRGKATRLELGRSGRPQSSSAALCPKGEKKAGEIPTQSVIHFAYRPQPTRYLDWHSA